MFKLNLSPVRSEDRLELSVAGDVLIINGDQFAASLIPDGATLPQSAVDCPHIVSDITRDGDLVELTLILPHGQNAPPETLFPVPIFAGDGPVTLPPYQIEDTTDED